MFNDKSINFFRCYRMIHLCGCLEWEYRFVLTKPATTGGRKQLFQSNIFSNPLHLLYSCISRLRDGCCWLLCCRDVFHQGSCDDSCQLLANELGFGVRIVALKLVVFLCCLFKFSCVNSALAFSIVLVVQEELKSLVEREHNKIDLAAKNDESTQNKKQDSNL